MCNHVPTNLAIKIFVIVKYICQNIVELKVFSKMILTWIQQIIYNNKIHLLNTSRLKDFAYCVKQFTFLLELQ